MKKIVINTENPNGTLVDMTAEEISQRETDFADEQAKATADETAKQAKIDLKASAKAKLIAGEALTEDEANTIVL
tara:strand:- start:159 stop:383 length:225 start_codon:yes stop_codon:yes gene_type:complete